jgi:hypothetical protein
VRLRRPSTTGHYDGLVADRIVSLISAEAGWRALYGSDVEADAESARVVAWALLENGAGAQRVVGLVVDGTDPTTLVPAPEATSELAPRFERYGFKPG